MTFALCLAVFGFLIATIVAPWVHERRVTLRRRRRELAACGGRVHPTTPPRFTRDDPSPRPRRFGDYEARAVADGEMQT